MNFVHKIVLLILVVVVTAPCSTYLNAQTEVNKTDVDSSSYDMEYQHSSSHMDLEGYEQTMNKAIHLANEANKQRNDNLKLKIDLLRASGHKKEAMALYDDLFAMNAKINDEAFERQIR